MTENTTEPLVVSQRAREAATALELSIAKGDGPWGTRQAFAAFESEIRADERERQK